MKALCWHGKEDIRCETVDDPRILDNSLHEQSNLARNLQ